MKRIFISYRREDSSGHTGHLHAVMVDQFGADGVFFDLDGIHPGEDDREIIQRACEASDALLVVIGPSWATAKDKKGRLRLEDATDLVRMEVGAGLKRKGMLVVPVLVAGAEMPDAETLPEDLKDLAFRNAWEIADRRFRSDALGLAARLKQARTTAGETARNPPPSNSLLSQRSLFPLCGVTLGKTTVAELAALGRHTTNINEKTGHAFTYYEVIHPDYHATEKINFWYYPSNIAGSIYLIRLDPMPQRWAELGLSWQHSYERWLSLLREFGYTVKVEEAPHIEFFNGRNFLKAAVTGRIKGLYPYEIELKFAYSRQVTTSAAGTLYSITVSARR